MLVEIGGNQLSFQVISRTGATVDSGTIQRQVRPRRKDRCMSHTPVRGERASRSHFILEYLLALPIGCAAALAWANTFSESYYRFAHATAFVVNDIGMAFFFALITKEVTEATLPGGALHPWRRAALPVAAAVGSVIVSVAIRGARQSR